MSFPVKQSEVVMEFKVSKGGTPTVNEVVYNCPACGCITNKEHCCTSQTLTAVGIALRVLPDGNVHVRMPSSFQMDPDIFKPSNSPAGVQPENKAHWDEGKWTMKSWFGNKLADWFESAQVYCYRFAGTARVQTEEGFWVHTADMSIDYIEERLIKAYKTERSEKGIVLSLLEEEYCNRHFENKKALDKLRKDNVGVLHADVLDMQKVPLTFIPTFLRVLDNQKGNIVDSLIFAGIIGGFYFAHVGTRIDSRKLCTEWVVQMGYKDATIHTAETTHSSFDCTVRYAEDGKVVRFKTRCNSNTCSPREEK